MTRQKMFNKVAKHLLTQKRKSGQYVMVDYTLSRPKREFICAYRGEDNTRCAIGALITNKMYNKYVKKEEQHNMQGGDGLPIYALNFEVRNYLEYTENEEFLLDLQEVHDTNKPSKWKSKLRTFAKIYDLNYDVLNQFN